MKLETCKAVRRRLAAYHDDELPVGERTAIRAHLAWCLDCTGQLADLGLVREAVRALVASRLTPAADPTADLPVTVVMQARAEQDVSFSARFRTLRDERHLLWAGAGAALATLIWAIAAAGLLYFVTPVRADSLAGILSALASPGSNENPFRPDERIMLPRVTTEGLLPGVALGDLAGALSDEEFVFALAAVITREGRVADLALLRPDHPRHEALASVLNAAATARFEPARFGSTPVAVSLVWLVTRTTVRGKLNG